MLSLKAPIVLLYAELHLCNPTVLEHDKDFAKTAGIKHTSASVTTGYNVTLVKMAITADVILFCTYLLLVLKTSITFRFYRISCFFFPRNVIREPSIWFAFFFERHHLAGGWLQLVATEQK